MKLEFSRNHRDEIRARESFVKNKNAKMIPPSVLVYLFGFAFFVFFAYYDRPFSRPQMRDTHSVEIFILLSLLLIISFGWYIFRILSIHSEKKEFFAAIDDLGPEYFGEVSVRVEQDRILVDTQVEQYIVPDRVFRVVEITPDFIFVEDGKGMLPWIPTTTFDTFQQGVDFLVHFQEPHSGENAGDRDPEIRREIDEGLIYLSSHGVDIYSYPELSESAEVARKAVSQGVEFLKDTWGLSIPEGTRIYIVRSWLDLFRKTSTLLQKIMGVILQPHVLVRSRRMWRVIGGAAGIKGKEPVIGLKSIDQLAGSDPLIGGVIFRGNLDKVEVYRRVVWHELVHAAMFPVSPPRWLNEGVAMLVVDQMSHGRSIRRGTRLALQAQRLRREPRVTYRWFFPNVISMYETYARGYWFVRFFKEAHPGLLLAFLQNHYRYGRFRKVIADNLDTSKRDVWTTLITGARDFFNEKLGEVEDDDLQHILDDWKEKYDRPRRIRSAIFTYIIGGLFVVLALFFVFIVILFINFLLSLLFQ